MPAAMHPPWIVPPDSMAAQIFWVLVLAIPIACVSRTVVFEEIFRELRDWCDQRQQCSRNLLARKLYYILTCEYCFSHYVTIFFLILTGFRLLIDDWRGYLLSFFALVLVANAYLNLYNRLRVDITQAKVQTKRLEKQIEGG